MFGWLKRKGQLAIVQSYDVDIQRFIDGLRGGSAEEVGMVVAFAADARAHLENQGHFVLKPVDAELATPFLALKINRMIQQLQKSGGAVVVPGFMVWLHTIRASGTPEIRFKGRLMWRELARGFPHAPAAAAGFRAMTGDELNIEGYTRIPLGLEDDGRS